MKSLAIKPDSEIRRSDFSGASPDAARVTMIREGYACYARRDITGVLTLFSPEIEIVQTDELPWGGQFNGLSGAKEFFSLLNQHAEGTPEPHSYVIAGRDVVVIGRLRGKARATGRLFDMYFVHLWTVDEMKVIRLAAFVDTPAMKLALSIL